MTYAAQRENKIMPSGTIIIRFVDTNSGKDTLHDTVGNIYQFR